jgi:hypothetical protein
MPLEIGATQQDSRYKKQKNFTKALQKYKEYANDLRQHYPEDEYRNNNLGFMRFVAAN